MIRGGTTVEEKTRYVADYMTATVSNSFQVNAISNFENRKPHRTNLDGLLENTHKPEFEILFRLSVRITTNNPRSPGENGD
jgi:hypothetical protein